MRRLSLSTAPWRRRLAYAVLLEALAGIAAALGALLLRAHSEDGGVVDGGYFGAKSGVDAVEVVFAGAELPGVVAAVVTPHALGWVCVATATMFAFVAGLVLLGRDSMLVSCTLGWAPHARLALPIAEVTIGVSATGVVITLLPPAAIACIAVLGAGLACVGYLLWRRLRSVGLMRFVSRDTRTFLMETTLLEWLTDTTFTDSVKQYLPFYMGLSDAELRTTLAECTPEFRGRLLRPGLMGELPEAVQALLLPEGSRFRAGSGWGLVDLGADGDGDGAAAAAGLLGRRGGGGGGGGGGMEAVVDTMLRRKSMARGAGARLSVTVPSSPHAALGVTTPQAAAAMANTRRLLARSALGLDSGGDAGGGGGGGASGGGGGDDNSATGAAKTAGSASAGVAGTKSRGAAILARMRATASSPSSHGGSGSSSSSGALSRWRMVGATARSLARIRRRSEAPKATGLRAEVMNQLVTERVRGALQDAVVFFDPVLVRRVGTVAAGVATLYVVSSPRALRSSLRQASSRVFDAALVMAGVSWAWAYVQWYADGASSDRRVRGAVGPSWATQLAGVAHERSGHAHLPGQVARSSRTLPASFSPESSTSVLQQVWDVVSHPSLLRLGPLQRARLLSALFKRAMRRNGLPTSVAALFGVREGQLTAAVDRLVPGGSSALTAGFVALALALAVARLRTMVKVVRGQGR